MPERLLLAVNTSRLVRVNTTCTHLQREDFPLPRETLEVAHLFTGCTLGSTQVAPWCSPGLQTLIYRLIYRHLFTGAWSSRDLLVMAA